MNRQQVKKNKTRTGEHEYDFELYHITHDRQLRGYIKNRALLQSDYRWGLAGLGPRKSSSLVPGLGVVWERAREALYHADFVGIVGFSFSGYDRFAQVEFARVMAGRASKDRPPQRIVLIDPALRSTSGIGIGNALAQRIETVFRPVERIGELHESIDWDRVLGAPERPSSVRVRRRPGRSR